MRTIVTWIVIACLLMLAAVLVPLVVSLNRELPPVPSPWRAKGE